MLIHLYQSDYDDVNFLLLGCLIEYYFIILINFQW